MQIVAGGKEFNGIVSFLHQYYSHMDQNKVHFDFFVVRENAFELHKDDPVFQDSAIYVLNAVKKNNRTDHIKMMEGLDRLLSKEHFDVVHINTLSVGAHVPLIHVCKKHHVQTIISHSHNEYAKKIRFSKLAAHKLFMSYINRNADYLFACSLKAGECLFGKRGVRLGKFKIINNAVNLDMFDFSRETRERKRKEYNISDSTILIGQVGRLSTQKNQEFAIDIFDAFRKQVPDSRFWIVGQGADREKLENKVESLGLSEYVVFLGQRGDVNDLLTAMDALLFPSLWEGFGTVAIEAQSTGLPILASDKISQEAAVTDLISFLPLNAAIPLWSEKLCDLTANRETRHSRKADLERSGFSIGDAAKKLEEFYCSRKTGNSGTRCG